MIRKILNNLYLIYFKYKSRKKGCIFAKNSSISSTDIFEGNNYISGRVIDSYVGYGTYISDRCFFRGCKIGKYCSIAPDVKMLRGTHPTRDFVSTSPAFYLKDNPVGKSYVDKDLFSPEARSKIDREYELVIGNDVWIGQHALLLQGISIGDGAIIGAGAVVTKDVPPYAIIGGVPAKVMRYRFEEQQIMALEKIKWWDRDEKWVMKHANLFVSIETFLDYMQIS